MIEKNDSTSTEPKRLLERRTVVKTAAWTVPAIALAVAAPAYAASAEINVGAFTLNAQGGLLNVVLPGFSLTAGDVALPVGTMIAVTGDGGLNVSVLGVTGGTASVNVLSDTSAIYTLTSELPAGATLNIRSLVAASAAFTFSGVVTLPSGYTSTGAKASASLSCTAVLCTAT